ncbi:MAG: hypothetical protein HC765_01870 [Brachymonas sp.]|nr:hypothetical protein [Brachymonas sp.]
MKLQQRLFLQYIGSWLCAVALLLPAAYAQNQLPPVAAKPVLAAPTSAVFDTSNAQNVDARLLTALRAITGLAADATPSQALAMATASPAALPPAIRVQNFDPQQVFEFNDNTALWLHLRVRSDPLSQQRWVINFVNTFLDGVELYVPPSSGSPQAAVNAWQRQIAGDHIAHSQWSQRTLSPQVILPVMAAGEHDILIKVMNGFAQQIPVKLMTQHDAEQANRDSFLRAGLLIGLLCVVLLLSMHLAFTYRDWTYACYAVYMLLAILAGGAYLGLASYVLWPDAERWPEHSFLVLIQAAVIAQLWFCQAMFLREGQLRELRLAVYATVGFSVVLGVVYFFMPQADQRNIVFALGAGICLAMIFSSSA